MEIGEVEAAFLALDAVDAAVVLPVKNGRDVRTGRPQPADGKGRTVR